jgi:hypothetical protein
MHPVNVLQNGKLWTHPDPSMAVGPAHGHAVDTTVLYRSGEIDNRHLPHIFNEMMPVQQVTMHDT